MRIAVFGIRGIPANYGGFETFAEEMCPRLAAKGHDVTVYCRTNNVTYEGDEYRGVRLVKLPTISSKYLDTPVHTLLSAIHALGARYDAVLVCNAANSVFAWIPRLVGTKVALNVDGIERLRKKWGLAGQLWYRIGERLAIHSANELVSDAGVIHDYYAEQYGAASTMIPYGADPERASGVQALEELGILPRSYVLYVSRLEPENNAHLLIEAFAEVKADAKLVVVGDAPYATAYKRKVEALAADDPRVILAGYVYGDGYRELLSNALCYVQATEVGGTHPALIEAMAVGNLVIGNGSPENKEVLGDTGLIYTFNDVAALRDRLQWALDNPSESSGLGAAARERALAKYSWDAVTAAYEGLFSRMQTRA